MKSIKEKAEEVFAIEEYDSMETELQRRKMRLCYEHGANYVLEQIEQLIYEKHVEGNLPLFDLTHLIDKLKEK